MEDLIEGIEEIVKEWQDELCVLDLLMEIKPDIQKECLLKKEVLGENIDKLQSLAEEFPI